MPRAAHEVVAESHALLGATLLQKRSQSPVVADLEREFAMPADALVGFTAHEIEGSDSAPASRQVALLFISAARQQEGLGEDVHERLLPKAHGAGIRKDCQVVEPFRFRVTHDACEDRDIG